MGRTILKASQLFMAYLYRRAEFYRDRCKFKNYDLTIDDINGGLSELEIFSDTVLTQLKKLYQRGENAKLFVQPRPQEYQTTRSPAEKPYPPNPMPGVQEYQARSSAQEHARQPSISLFAPYQSQTSYWGGSLNYPNIPPHPVYSPAVS